MSKKTRQAACRWKRGALLLVLLMAGWQGLLAASGKAEDYSVRYVSHHYLYQKDGETTVIDYRVEWPEWLGSSRVDALQRYMAGKLFQVGADGFDAAEAQFLARYGHRVTGVLDSVPDDAKFCYVQVRAEMLSYVPGRFVAYSLSSSVSPQPRSSQKAYAVSEIVTYDLENTLYRSDGIINVEKLRWGAGFRYDRFMESLAAHMSPAPSEDDLYGIEHVTMQCYPDAEGNLVFVVGLMSKDAAEPMAVRSRVPYRDVKPYVSPKARKLFDAKALPETSRGKLAPGQDTLAAAPEAEAVPPYPGGKKALAEYLAAHMNTPLLEAAGDGSTATTLRLSVALRADGTLDHMRFLTPAPPELCREVYRVFSLIPAQRFANGGAAAGDGLETYTFRLRLAPQPAGH